MKFVPILKTKASAELAFIRMFKNCFSDEIFPYIEVIKNPDDDLLIKYFSELGNVKCIYEVYPNISGNNLTKRIDASKKIEDKIDFISINLMNIEIELEELSDYIEHLHENGKKVGLRIKVGEPIDLIRSLLDHFNKDDILFVDIENNDYYSSTFYLEDLVDIFNKDQIVIFGEDRPNTPARELNSHGYNYELNMSILDAFKNNVIEVAGFGTYCSARNAMSDENKHAYKGRGCLILYNIDKNLYFSVTSNENKTLSIAYKDLREKIIEDKNLYDEIIDEQLKNVEITKDYFADYINNHPGSPAKFVLFGICCYFENIYNYLFRQS